MNKTRSDKLIQLASEPGKDIKTWENLIALSAQLLKFTIEADLRAEMVLHLGYPGHFTRRTLSAKLPQPHNAQNS